MKQVVDGRTALVTGAAGAIGSAIARNLASQGYLVVCIDRETEGLDRMSHDLPGALTFACDVRQESSVLALRDKVFDSIANIDLLVNAAGIFLLHDLVSTTEALFDEIIGVNLKGTFLVCKAFIPAMIENGGGAIVNIASTAGLHAGSRRPIYSASKAAVILLTRSIALDYGPKGVRANCVCPGLIDTPMAEWLVSDPEKFRQWQENLPAGRIGTTNDIAGVVGFLGSEEASYMQGAVVVVDGGGMA